MQELLINLVWIAIGVALIAGVTSELVAMGARKRYREANQAWQERQREEKEYLRRTRERDLALFPTLELALDTECPNWREITGYCDAPLRALVDSIRTSAGLEASDRGDSMWRVMKLTDSDLAKAYETNYPHAS